MALKYFLNRIIYNMILFFDLLQVIEHKQPPRANHEQQNESKSKHKKGLFFEVLYRIPL